MKCLCCGKEILNENESSWHTNCIQKFFHKSDLPQIELDNEVLKNIILSNVNNKVMIPGVQKKLSLGFSAKSKRGRLIRVDYPCGYILKPQVKDYPNLPEIEHVTMLLADASKIETVPHALIKCDDELAFITKRVDRDFNEDKVKQYAMEDFCQLSQKLTYQKYNGSYEKCVAIINRYSSMPGIDIAKFFVRLVFCFITGNSDMHLKNFSLIADLKDPSSYRLSPAYDLVSTNLVLKADEEEFALTMNGKKRNFTKNDFIKFGINTCNLTKKAVLKLINDLTNLKEEYFKIIDESELPNSIKKEYKELIDNRISRLL